MLAAKIIEIRAESPTSFEDAIAQGIAKASETAPRIKTLFNNTGRQTSCVQRVREVRCMPSLARQGTRR